MATQDLESALIRLDQESRSPLAFYNALLGLLGGDNDSTWTARFLGTIPKDDDTQTVVSAAVNGALRQARIEDPLAKSILARLDRCFLKK